MENFKSIADIDPYTGKEIIRFPRFKKFNVHTYYSRRAFHPSGKMIAYSSLDSAEITDQNRLALIPGTVHVLTFPEGNVIHTIDNLPTGRHGGNHFEFTPCGKYLALHLEDKKLGLYDLSNGELKMIQTSGPWESFGADEDNNIAIIMKDNSLFAARLDKVNGQLIKEYPIAKEEEILKESRYREYYDQAAEVKFNNVKLSHSGKYCIFVVHFLDASGKVLSKELFLGALDGSQFKSIAGGSKEEFESPARAFHHHAWVMNQDKVLNHAASKNFDRMTYHTYDVKTERTEEI